MFGKLLGGILTLYRQNNNMHMIFLLAIIAKTIIVQGIPTPEAYGIYNADPQYDPSRCELAKTVDPDGKKYKQGFTKEM